MSARDNAILNLSGLNKARFWTHFKQSAGCWQWEGSLTMEGYAKFSLHRRTVLAHRIMFWLKHGYLPDVIDHLCRNRSCVNPDHMEAVTNTENVLRGIGITATNKRKTHCVQGHSLWARRKNGQRYCLECKRDYNRRWAHQDWFKKKAIADAIRRGGKHD